MARGRSRSESAKTDTGWCHRTVTARVDRTVRVNDGVQFFDRVEAPRRDKDRVGEVLSRYALLSIAALAA